MVRILMPPEALTPLQHYMAGGVGEDRIITPYTAGTGVGGYAPSVITTGDEPGGYLWRQREAEAVKERVATVERERIEAYLTLQAEQARARTLSETKAREERERVLEERRLQQVSTRRGISYRQQQAEQREVVKQAEFMKQEGKEYSSRAYAEELGRRTGLSPGEAISKLRVGTKAEQRYFKRTGISLEAKRKFAREVALRERTKGVVSEAVLEDLQTRALQGDKNASQSLLNIGYSVSFLDPSDAKLDVGARALSFIESSYRGIEDWGRREVTYPIAERLSSVGLDIEGSGLIAGATAPTWITPGLTITPTKKEREFQIARTRGQILELKERPLKVSLTTAAFFVLPGVLKPVGKVVAPIAKALPTLSKAVSSAVKVGVPLTYAGITGYRVMKEPTAKARGEMLGRIETGELLPMGLGTYAGAKFWPKVSGWRATRGRPIELQTEKLIPKEVLYGKKIFPEAPTKLHLQKFLKESQRIPGIKEPIMYHATGEQFWNEKFLIKQMKLRPKDFPGLYGAPGVSPHFLRVTGEAKLYGGAFFEPYTKPGVLGIIPKGFVKGTTARPGYAFVPGVKREVEAILGVGTRGEIISTERFFKWKGVRVPLDIAKVSTGLEATKTMKSISKMMSSSYGGLPRTYLSTPSSLALSSYLGLKPSKPSKPSKVSRVSKRVSISKEISKAISYSPISYKRITRGLQEPFYYSYKAPKKPLKKITPYYPTEELIREPLLRTTTILLGAARMVKRKKKKVKGKFRDELFYVPSMTAHVLGIKKVMSEKEMLRKAQLGITLREVPIIR